MVFSKSLLLVSAGLFNILHALLHVLQVFQSFYLTHSVLSSTCGHSDNLVEKILHSPYAAILWVIVGLSTLVIGVRDFIHHKRCYGERGS